MILCYFFFYSITDHITVPEFQNITKWLLTGLNRCKGCVYARPFSLSFQDPHSLFTNKGFTFKCTKFWQVHITLLSITLWVLMYSCCFTTKIINFISVFLKASTQILLQPLLHTHCCWSDSPSEAYGAVKCFLNDLSFSVTNNYILRCVEVIVSSCLFYLILQNYKFLTMLAQA